MSRTVAHTLESAVQHHQGGRFAEAEALYRQILAQEPQNPDALHLLGVLTHQMGNNAAALELIRQAVAISPMAADFRINMASVLTAMSRLEEALQSAKHAVELNPESVLGQFALGKAFAAVGRLDEAVAAYLESVRLSPNFPGYFQLGQLLAEQGKFDRASAAFSEAVRLKPDHAQAWSNLATAQKDLGKLDDAVAAYRESLRLNPDSAESHNNLGNVLNEQGKTAEAIAEYRHALKLRPDVPLAHYNLGIALANQGKSDEAIAAYRDALRLDPDYADAHANLGLMLTSRNKLAEAIESFSNAIRVKPDFGEAHWGLASALLLGGDFENGWREFEWRWQSASYRGAKRPFPQAQWDGRELDGKRILIQAEGGLGDTIHFVRYIPLLSARGGKVILECQAPLVPLLRDLAGLEQIIPAGERSQSFDVVCPLMSLPLIFKTTLQTIPASIPSIRADPERTEIWSKKLPSDPSRPRIGLAWAGNPDYKSDRLRSIPLRQFAPLAAISKSRFHTLQLGPSAIEIAHQPPGLELIDFTRDLHDFADTAAMIANLDLVISVDTSVAHLAGAMGKPVWILVPFSPDWRWLLHREDSPWYPTMRLFRQKSHGDWADVIQHVADSLAGFAGVRQSCP